MARDSLPPQRSWRERTRRAATQRTMPDPDAQIATTSPFPPRIICIRSRNGPCCGQDDIRTQAGQLLTDRGRWRAEQSALASSIAAPYYATRHDAADPAAGDRSTMCCLCLSRRTLLAAAAILPLAPACAATASDAPVEPRMRLADPTSDRLVVALTLDACPGDFDARIATALVESGIPATIFATGLWLRRNQPAWRFYSRIAICSASRTTASCISRRFSARAKSTAFRSPAILPPCGARLRRAQPPSVPRPDRHRAGIARQPAITALLRCWKSSSLASPLPD